MTQMQHPNTPERVGSFYAEGSLPSDFANRADVSGIGLKSQIGQEIGDKSVYLSKVAKTAPSTYFSLVG